MLVVEELYKEAVVGTDRNLIIFNRELDRIISGCISFLKLEVLFSFFCFVLNLFIFASILLPVRLKI
jgi:hypothetical protein